MKISYRTHPILSYLLKGKPKVSVNPASIKEIEKWGIGQFFKIFDGVWDNIIGPTQPPVFIMANTFANAVEFSMSKLYSLKLNDEIKQTSGVLCWGVLTIIYKISQCPNDNVSKWQGDILVFSNEYLAVLWTNNKIIYCAPGFKISPDIEVVKGFLSMILAVDMFKKYAEIETKNLPPNSKQKDLSRKYVNETNLNIIYLDSKWYTNLVKKDGFMVRGHLRLQPCGEGLKDRKLIYIDPFMKTGYTAPARKLSQA